MANGDATGASGFSSYNSAATSPGPLGTSGNVGSGAAPSFAFNIPGIEQTNDQISALTENLQSLKATVTNLGNNQAQMSGNINSLMNSATNAASSANRTVTQMSGGSMGSSTYATASGIPYSTNTGSTLSQSIASGMSGSSLGSLGGIAETLSRMTLLPVRYAFDRIEENRMNTLGMAQALGPVSTLTGSSIPEIMATFSNQIPVQGNINDILAATQIGAASGYGRFDSARSGSYFTAIREMQALTPGVGAGQLAAQYSAHLGNTKAQQTSMMLTGGAMGSFAAGGRPKTLSEWAEGLLKFFQGLRPGSERGKPFKKEELEVQMFPGSNMDAWMNANGVPDYMRNYFWQYAMSKVTLGGSGSSVISQIGEARGGDLAYERLRLNSATARREFELSSGQGITFASGTTPMYQQYIQREGADRDFMGLMRYLDKALGSMAGTFGGMIANTPTPLAEIGANMLFNTAPNAVGSLVGAIPFIGDTPGNYGAFGGTSTANMDPSFARKVQAMQQANPRIQITSGFRDGGLQGKLHRNGVGRVAPAGQSMHSRGLAADLGPSSEFGWIAANAHKFGLESGKHHGEPWHVGAPGTIGIGDPGDGIFGGWGPSWGDVAGAATQAVGTTIGATIPGAGLIGSVAGSIGGAMGGKLIGGAVDAVDGIQGVFKVLSSLAELPLNVIGGVQQALSGNISGLFGGGGMFDLGSVTGTVSNSIFDLLGLPSGLNPFSGNPGDAASALGFLQGGMLTPQQKSNIDWSQKPGGLPSAGGVTGAISTGPANLQSIFQKYNGGASAAAAQVSPQQEAGIIKALQAAAAAGFKGDELIAATAIAGRESGWNPTAHRSTADKSKMIGDRGLWQINYTWDDDLAGAGIIPSDTPSGRRSLLDGNVNAKAAYFVSSSGSNFQPWSYGPGGWGTGPPLYKASQYVEPVYNIAKEAGFIGDPGWGGGGIGGVSVVSSPYNMTSLSSSPIEIRNTFHVTSTGGEIDTTRLASVITDKIFQTRDDAMSRTR